MMTAGLDWTRRSRCFCNRQCCFCKGPSVRRSVESECASIYMSIMQRERESTARGRGPCCEFGGVDEKEEEEERRKRRKRIRRERRWGVWWGFLLDLV